jgi:hypothetical protein
MVILLLFDAQIEVFVENVVFKGIQSSGFVTQEVLIPEHV